VKYSDKDRKDYEAFECLPYLNTSVEGSVWFLARLLYKLGINPNLLRFDSSDILLLKRRVYHRYGRRIGL